MKVMDLSSDWNPFSLSLSESFPEWTPYHSMEVMWN